MELKNITKLMAAVILPLTMFGTAAPVLAEENSTDSPEETVSENIEDSQEEGVKKEESAAEEDYSMLPTIPYGATGSLTIRYYDDSYETVPAAGSEFTAYKVAEISRGYISAGVEGDESKPLVIEESGLTMALFEDIPIEKDTDPVDVTEAVMEKYSGGDVPENGLMLVDKIADNGILTFEDMPVGVYLIVETNPIHYHIATAPFFVSIPETVHTEDGLAYWNFDVKAEPKVNLAGSLVVEKIIAGSGADKNKMFTFKVNIADGEYVCIMPNGTMDVIHDGDAVVMRGGQHFSIVNLPAGTEYKVVEAEANKDGYTTTYKDSEGLIVAKDVKKATVKNYKDEIPTGVGGIDPMYLYGFAGAAFALLILLIAGRKIVNE